MTTMAGQITVANLVAGTLTTWTGRSTSSTPVAGATTARYPVRSTDDGDSPDIGAAVFTKSGDFRAVGWLTQYGQTLFINEPH